MLSSDFGLKYCIKRQDLKLLPSGKMFAFQDSLGYCVYFVPEETPCFSQWHLHINVFRYAEVLLHPSSKTQVEYYVCNADYTWKFC